MRKKALLFTIFMLSFLGYSSIEASLWDKGGWLAHSTYPKESFAENFNPWALFNYLSLTEHGATFLGRMGFLTPERLKGLVAPKTLEEIPKENLLTRTINRGINRGINWFSTQKIVPQEEVIKKTLKIPGIQAIKRSNLDSAIVQGSTLAALITSFSGLHYYHQWPLREMEKLENKYHKEDGKFNITLLMLKNIKESIDFWHTVLIITTGRALQINNTWTTLKEILEENNSTTIKTLLFNATKRLELMHGISKYTPSGIARKATELTRDVSYSPTGEAVWNYLGDTTQATQK